MNLDEKIDVHAQTILRLEDALMLYRENKDPITEAIKKEVKRHGMPEDEQTRRVVEGALHLAARKGKNPLLTTVDVTLPIFDDEGKMTGVSFKHMPESEAQQKLLELRTGLGNLLKQKDPQLGDNAVEPAIDRLLEETARADREGNGMARRRGQIAMN